MNILEQLAAHARERVAADKEAIPLEEMKERAAACKAAEHHQAPAVPHTSGEAFTAALSRPGLSFICEVKKASPSKGLISPEFPYREIARDYEAAGADAVSCLTEPKWFLGSDDIFREVRSTIRIPMLRKDFTVDAYQIYQAKTMGASAILLICGILDTASVARYLEICEELDLAALTEAHTEEQIGMAVTAGARIIGVNNRDLRNFTVDFSNAARLRDRIPPESLYVAESGVTGPEDAAALKKIGADAVLIGETLMCAEDKAGMLAKLKAAGET